MRDRFHAKSERSLKLRFHSQTAGVSLTAQQPYNNVVRTALQALSAVLGGTQSLHTNSLDEALALPTSEAVTIALRTQQIIAHESGVANVVDPLGGSYFIEKLTQDMERETLAIFRTIDEMGGMVAAIEHGYPQKEIAESAYLFQQAVERREKIIVGVNDFVAENEAPVPTLYIDEAAAERQLAKLERLRRERDRDRVERALDALRTRGRAEREHDGPDPRSGPRLRDGRRDVRRAARGVGRVRRGAGGVGSRTADGKQLTADPALPGLAATLGPIR